MAHPAEYKLIESFPLERRVWLRDEHEGATGPFETYGVMASLTIGDPDHENTRAHAMLLDGRTAPLASVVWNESEADELRAFAAEAARAALEVEARRVEEMRARQVAEAEAELARIKGSA